MRGRWMLAGSVAATTIVAALVACSGDDDGGQPLNAVRDAASPSVDATTSTDGGADASDAAQAADANPATDAGRDSGDAGPAAVNGCLPGDFAANDYSAPDASRVIYFADSGTVTMITLPDGGQAPFVPQCMRVKVGETVGWNGNFEAHPIGASFVPGTTNKDPGNPLPSLAEPITDAGPDATYWATFAEAGTFGYECQVHGNMIGAVNVVP